MQRERLCCEQYEHSLLSLLKVNCKHLHSWMHRYSNTEHAIFFWFATFLLLVYEGLQLMERLNRDTNREEEEEEERGLNIKRKRLKKKTGRF